MKCTINHNFKPMFKGVERTRYSIDCLKIEGGRAIATDGRILAVSPVESDGDGYIPKACLPGKTGGEVVISNGETRLSVKGKVKAVEPSAGDISFPPFAAVMPEVTETIPVSTVEEGTQYLRFALNAKSLSNLAEAVAGENGVIEMLIPDKPNKPAVIVGHDAYGGRGTGVGVIMPANSEIDPVVAYSKIRDELREAANKPSE